MNRYDRNFRTPAARRGYDEDVQQRGGRGQFRAGGRESFRDEVGRGGGMPGGSRYGSDFRASQGRPQPGRQRGWGMEPGSELTGGYSDYSPRGRFGGYFGAWDTRPLGSRADVERESRERQSGRRGNR